MTKNLRAALASTAALAVMAAGSASAADVIGSAPPPPSVPVESYTPYTLDDVWTGFYAGAHVGGYIADNDDDDGEWLGGLQAGYNHQFDMFVLGGEVSASFADGLTYGLATGDSISQDWMLGVSARAGVAFDHTLVYGTLGYNWAELYGSAMDGEDTVGGISFGAGVEHQFGNGLGAKLEYTQTRFDDVETFTSGDVDLVNHAVKVGLNFHF